MFRSLLPFAILSVLAVASSWYISEIEGGLARERQAGSEAPRAFGTRIAYIDLGENGQPAFRIEARGMAKGPGESGTDLVEPRFTGYAKGQVARRGRADRGWLAEARDEVRLFDDVQLEKLDTKDDVPAVLSTPYLAFFPERNVAETDREVRIVTGSTTVDAVGMRVDLDRDQVLFKSQVRAHHRPESRTEEP